MNEYICPVCKTLSYSAADFEHLKYRTCERCGATVVPSPPQKAADRLTLDLLLGTLDPETKLFIVHRLGPHEAEAVAEGTAAALAASRCVEVCGDNIVERVSVSLGGYPWEQDASLLVTISGKAAVV